MHFWRSTWNKLQFLAYLAVLLSDNFFHLPPDGFCRIFTYYVVNLPLPHKDGIEKKIILLLVLWLNQVPITPGLLVKPKFDWTEYPSGLPRGITPYKYR